HLAGVLDDGPLSEQDRDRFRKVLAPKVAGAWYLHELTDAQPLSFFVLFSSAAALVGSPGQSGYAAANAFLDALAQQRRAQVRPGLALAFGPWAEVGMAARSGGRAIQRARQQGLGAHSPAQGLAMLGTVLAAGLAGPVAVLPPAVPASDPVSAAPASVPAQQPLDPRQEPVAARVERLTRRALGLSKTADLRRTLHE